MTKHSHKQTMEALEQANAVRLKRSALRRELREGKVLLSEILREDPVPEDMATEYVAQLLRSVPRIGRTRADEILNLASRNTPFAKGEGRHADKQLGELTERQRGAIADVLEAIEQRKANWRQGHGR